MTEHHHKRVRLAFEPNRFASEQLAKVYEQLEPMESRTTPTRPSSEPADSKRSSAKEGAQ